MAHWEARVDLKQEWAKANAGELTACELGKAVAEKVRAVVPRGDLALIGILVNLRSLSQDADFDDFDAALGPLYY